MPIQLPDIDPKRELARKLAESIVSKIPIVGGPYVAMLSVTHRSDAEKKIAKWREDLTEVVNRIEKATTDLLPTIKLSNDASAIGLWLCESSELGRGDIVMFESIVSAFPAGTKVELQDACGELAIEGLVTISATTGHTIRLVNPTSRLFEIFDPITINGTNPRMDAAELAKFTLSHDGTVSAEEMVKHFHWPPRRLNPAVSILCSMVGPGRKSAENHPIYLCRYIMPDPAERAVFRRYIDRTIDSVEATQ
jgi:hypothetical protein